MARVARLGVVVNDLDRSRLGWIGAWLIGHMLTRQPVHPPRRAAVGPARRTAPPRRSALLRAAGLAPVRTVRGAFGHRYAIAALPRRTADRTGRTRGRGE